MLEGIQFSSFAEFVNMGGYAFNVWSVYFLFGVFLLVNLAGPLHRKKRILRELQSRDTLNRKTSVPHETE